MNHAGFGVITDLRDDLYNAILRRSAAFFSKHATGTLLSTIINDIERIQYAMSTVLSEALQQFFTFSFGGYRGCDSGRKPCLGLASIRACDYLFIAQDRFSRPPYHAARPGQAGGNSEHPA